LLLFFSLCAISKASEIEPAKTTVSSTLVEGTWSVDSSSTVKFTYKFDKKVRHKVFSFDTSETWTFTAPNVFSSTDSFDVPIGGTWREKGTKVTVVINRPEFDTYLEDGLAFEGLSGASININKMTGTGTVGKSGNTLSGKQTISAGFSYFDPIFGVTVTGTVAVTTHFVGVKTDTPGIVNGDAEAGGSLRTAISELVKQALSSPEE
jgi:hypothetical protein